MALFIHSVVWASPIKDIIHREELFVLTSQWLVIMFVG